MAANHRYRTTSKPAQITLDQEASTRDNLDSSSEYSDWLSQSAHQLTFSPPKQKKRRKRRPTNKNTKLKVEQSTEQQSPQKNNSVWLTEVIPWKMPYFPQMGDDVVYFLQGHQIYLDAIKDNTKYVACSNEPWTKLHLKANEFCKIVGIKYETHNSLPVCCLKLSLTDQDGHLTGESFSIKYHPVKNVHDFLILKQVYTKSIEKTWTIGTRYKHLNADHVWSFVVIQALEPFQGKFPKSNFRCCRVRWDNEVINTLSPWDLEPIDESVVLTGTTLDNSMVAQPKDIRKFLFQPQPQDWPTGDRGIACRKLLRALNEVLQLPIAGDFINPVQSLEVEYPVNLAIIKARLENRFYRYIASVKFDIRYLAKNAERSNSRHSVNVQYARILVDICLEIIRNLQNNVNVTDYYRRFLADFNWSDSDMEVEEAACVSPPKAKSPANQVSEENQPAEQTPSACTSRRDNNYLQNQPSTTAHKSYISPQKTPKRCAQSIKNKWKDQCRQVLKIVWDSKDSIPFRQPVDPLDFPDYEVMVPTPMCLHYIDENLEVDNYRDPKQIYDDLRLVISNSRRYNNNRQSEVYIKTTRLSNVIDDLMKPILRSYTLTRNQSVHRERSPRDRCIDEDEMEEMSSESFDDINNDPTWKMSSQDQTQESEAFSQVVNKLSQELEDAKLQSDVSNVCNIPVQVRDLEARNNDNRAVAINVNDDVQANEDTDTGFEDHSNCSDSWEEVLRTQICLNKNCYQEK